MPLLTKATKAVTDRLPKVISPRAHAVLDYATAAVFLGASVAFWKRNRPAALSAILCGGSQLLLATMTDYPGGLVRSVSFETHGRMDGGFALLAATLPELMKFADSQQARFFDLQAVNIAATAGLTDFMGPGERKQLKKLEERRPSRAA